MHGAISIRKGFSKLTDDELPYQRNLSYPWIRFNKEELELQCSRCASAEEVPLPQLMTGEAIPIAQEFINNHWDCVPVYGGYNAN